MRIAFEDTALEGLYVNGATDSSKYIVSYPKTLSNNTSRWSTISVLLGVWKICFASSRSITRKRKATCRELMPYG